MEKPQKSQEQKDTDAAVSAANDAARNAAKAAKAVQNSAGGAQQASAATVANVASAAANAAKAASEAAAAASKVAEEVSGGSTGKKQGNTRATVRKVMLWLRQITLIAASLVLLFYITVDVTHNGIPLATNHDFNVIQFWVCIIFLVDIVIGFFLSDSKGKYCQTNFLFFLVSIPYLSIFEYFNITLLPAAYIALRIIPLVRGAFALAIVIGWMIYDKASTLFVTYLTVLVACVYFSSVAFYASEHGVNPLVKDFADAIWWACMDTTTVGCNIEAITPTGKVLSVLLACMGMMMLPLFTVYITSVLQKKPDFTE